ncbi:hypothetical protein [Streptacidiphilus rugosus]|uniref:hypothetical protein n=1 Tax=Streptacidiphilus rugosus TaxID=405783 RepID=UPI001E33737C|nr:hypothetical protein [Streptacidiphilus rugosus]
MSVRPFAASGDAGADSGATPCATGTADAGTTVETARPATTRPATEAATRRELRM